jgi:adenine/guanine/hypoxanthine permease
MATSPAQQGATPPPNQEDLDIVQHLGRSRYFGCRDFLDRVDHYVTTSAFGYFFTLSGTGHVRRTLSICAGYGLS